MLIIAGYMEMDPSERDAYVAAHADLIQRARGAEGCLDLAISADTVAEGRVNLFERWESQDALDAWRVVANGPNVEVEYTGGDIMMYHIDHLSPAFE